MHLLLNATYLTGGVLLVIGSLLTMADDWKMPYEGWVKQNVGMAFSTFLAFVGVVIIYHSGYELTYYVTLLG